MLRSPTNTTTANTSAAFRTKLWKGQLLALSSTRYLLDLMFVQVHPQRLRAGIPPSVCLADKTGTAGIEGLTLAWNDIGLVTFPDGRALVITGYLSHTAATTQ